MRDGDDGPRDAARNLQIPLRNYHANDCRSRLQAAFLEQFRQDELALLVADANVRSMFLSIPLFMSYNNKEGGILHLMFAHFQFSSQFKPVPRVGVPARAIDRVSGSPSFLPTRNSATCSQREYEQVDPYALDAMTAW